MEARELRIGNLIVDYECEPHYFEVEEIKKNTQGNLSVYYRKGSCMSVDPEPIPLTEEWLLRFGFTKYQWCDDCAFITLHNQHLFVRKFKGNWFIRKARVRTNQSGMTISEGVSLLPKRKDLYVHQLQNLYFALTGKELELKD